MATQAEKAHLQAVAEIGCIVCRNLGYYGIPAEVHHIRKGVGMGMRNSHYRTIPLCPSHHRTGGYGVAYHAGAKGFEKNYGTEEELLSQVKNILGID